jgi:hypothetical protein
VVTRVAWEAVRPFLSHSVASKVVLASGGRRPVELSEALPLPVLRHALVPLDPMEEGEEDPWDVSDDEDEIVCRICRMEGEDDWPLFFPCKCSGSIKWVHQDCLQTWMQHSGITSCELCKHAFDFTPICDSTSNPTVACDVWLHVDMLLVMTDSPDAPKELPAHELLRGLFT